MCETGLAACHDVFESSWSWAEGTGWILTVPLFAIIWLWKHTSYVALMIKLILVAAIYSCLQLIFLLSTHSQRIHWPCLARGTAFALLTASSCQRTSSTSVLQSDVVAFHQVCSFAFRPKPLTCWICPTMSLSFRADVACCTASDGVHFRPVTRGGAAALMVLCLESFSQL